MYKISVRKMCCAEYENSTQSLPNKWFILFLTYERYNLKNNGDREQDVKKKLIPQLK